MDAGDDRHAAEEERRDDGGEASARPVRARPGPVPGMATPGVAVGHELPAHLPGGEVAHDFFGTASDREDADFAVDALDLHAEFVTRAAEDL